jgi:hypothetical protein
MHSNSVHVAIEVREQVPAQATGVHGALNMDANFQDQRMELLHLLDDGVVFELGGISHVGSVCH